MRVYVNKRCEHPGKSLNGGKPDLVESNMTTKITRTQKDINLWYK